MRLALGLGVTDVPVLAGGLLPMPMWAAAKAAVIAGTRNAKIVFMGDSTTAGFGGQPAGYPGAQPFSYPMQMAPLLANSGVQTFTGTNNVSTGGGPTQDGYDSRFSVYSANWGPASTTLAGEFLSNLADTTALSFTPTLAFDTLDVYSAAQAGLGTFTTDVDGGAVLATVVQDNGGAAAYVKTTVSCALGTHTINFKRVSGTVYIGAFVAYKSSVKQVTFHIAGWAGGKAADLSDHAFSNAYTSIGALKGIAPDLTVLCCTINDWQANSALAQYKSDIQNIITAAKLSGDVLMMSGFPTAAVITSVAQQQTFIDAYAALAASNGANLINLTKLFGSWEAANTASEAYDNSHPNSTGYAVIAAKVSAYL